MFTRPRQYRAVALSSTAESADDAINTLSTHCKPKEFKVRNEMPSGGRVLHGYYYSTYAYTSNEEILSVIQTKFKGETRFRYDIFVVEWQIARSIAMAFFVPFSAMGKEVFGTIDENLKPFRRQYRRINLDKMVDALFKGSSTTIEFSATKVHFLVDGSDSVTAVRLLGSNVLSSKLYRTLRSDLDGLALEPRKIGLLYARDEGMMSMSADGFGNFWFRLGREGAGLEAVPEMFRGLERAGILEPALDCPALE